jgi:NAD(P)-dependent dehydrogenase (short-subunit alcohol dehydrogenase family)
VHITELGGEYFRFDEARQELRGERTGIRYAIGTRVQIQVSRVDLDGRKIDFRLVNPAEEFSARQLRDKGVAKSGAEGTNGSKGKPKSRPFNARKMDGMGSPSRHGKSGPNSADFFIKETTRMTQSSKIAIVTGAGSGIGKATALALLNAGWSVVLAGRRVANLEEVVAEAKAINPNFNVLAVPTDVTQEDSVANLFAQCVKTFGRVDLLFNNAGVSTPAIPLPELSLDMWKGVVDTNLTGMFLCIREAFRVMKDQKPMGGRIINNGSISATTPRPFSIAYTSTKHAVSGLTKTASLDGRQYDIAVGQIDVGNAATPMAMKMAKGVPQANLEIKAEPLMDVALVGTSVVYMASLPLEANVMFHTVMATKMPFAGRG